MHFWKYWLSLLNTRSSFFGYHLLKSPAPVGLFYIWFDNFYWKPTAVVPLQRFLIDIAELAPGITTGDPD